MDNPERKGQDEPPGEHAKARQMQESHSRATIAELQRLSVQGGISYPSTVQPEHLARSTSPYDMSSMTHVLPDYALRQQYPTPSTQLMPHGTILSPSYSYPYSMQSLSAQAPGPYPPQYQSMRGPPAYGTHAPQQQYTMHSRGYFSHYAPTQTHTHTSRPDMNYLTSGTYSGRLPDRSQPHQQSPTRNTSATVRRESFETTGAAGSGLRGPPRKPKQSGHALWVGNLPSGTPILELKDHFSQEATDDIESVFLISKSNCAFVNYKSEDSCMAAMTRFHDSRFRGVRLVCRLRRGNTAQGLSAMPSTEVSATETSINQGTDSSQPVPSDGEVGTGAITSQDLRPQGQVVKERFFVVKSLTLDDLERSVQNGVWATQAHNEENLNQAFATAEDVYLIFSANKSGEYFGYARMDSFVGDESVSDTSTLSATVLANSATRTPDAPRLVPTPATATAPEGHVIDDSARGTIFWEAESATVASQSGLTEGDADYVSGEDEHRSPGQTTFGKPFKVVWQSTERLPFYRTRGLRNPWNANREVKIARDGTELEPGVGRKLLGLFELQAQINTAVRSAPAQQFGYPPPSMYQGGPTAYGFVPPGAGYGQRY